MSELTTTQIEALHRLLDEAACRNVICDYAKAVDALDDHMLEQQFWPDAFIDLGLFSGEPAKVVPKIHELEAGFIERQHLLAGASIMFNGTLATADIPSFVQVRAKGETEYRDDLIWGRYKVTFEKRADEWRMSRMGIHLSLFRSFTAPLD